MFSAGDDLGNDSFMPDVVMWLIWKEKNRNHFNGIENPLNILNSVFIILLFSWESREGNPSLDQSLDFIELFDTHRSVHGLFGLLSSFVYEWDSLNALLNNIFLIIIKKLKT